MLYRIVVFGVFMFSIFVLVCDLIGFEYLLVFLFGEFVLLIVEILKLVEWDLQFKEDFCSGGKYWVCLWEVLEFVFDLELVVLCFRSIQVVLDVVGIEGEKVELFEVDMYLCVVECEGVVLKMLIVVYVVF